MAYLAFNELPTVAAAPVSFRAATAGTATGFSGLEWSVIALAERDTLATLRTPGRIAVALGTIFGDRPNPRLADTRLEALRQIAVLSWNYGYTVPGDAVKEFTAAGFTLDQYETLVDSISVARAKRNRKHSA